jgi:8-oxo-dGTP pyrophosphatase MutT (NUDIX family)
MEAGCRLLARGPFREERVEVVLTNEARPTSAALEARIARRWTEALERARRERRDLFDGRLLRWLRREPAVGADGAARLKFVVGPGSFRDFVGTNLDPTLRPGGSGAPAAADGQDGSGGTVPWDSYGNAVGISALVVTRDWSFVLGRRSERVLGLSGELHTLGGMLEERDAVGGSVDCFGAIRRELLEELGLARADVSELLLLGAAVEPRIHQPELLFEARTTLSFAELRERFATAASRAEHSELVELPPEPHALAAAVERAAPVSAIGRAALALSLAPPPDPPAPAPERP